MKKLKIVLPILLVIASLFIHSCGTYVDEGAIVTYINTSHWDKKKGAICEYELRTVNGMGDRYFYVLDMCGKYNVGDTIYLSVANTEINTEENNDTIHLNK